MSTLKANRIENLTTTDGGIDINNSGNVGVGASSPGANLEVRGSSSNGQIRIGGSTSGTYSQIYSDNDGVLILNADQGNNAASSYLGLNVDNSERLRIDSSGRLLIGTTSALDVGSTKTIQVVNTSTASLSLGRNDGTISAGNDIGAIRFWGNAGGSYQQCAEILAEADGTHANNDKPTRLVFSTTADSGSSPTERMRIDSSGHVGIKSSSPSSQFFNDLVIGDGTSDHGITLHAGSTNASSIAFSDSTSGTGRYSGRLQYDHNSDSMRFYTNNGDERMRIDSAGRVGIGETNNASYWSGANRLVVRNSGDAGATIVSGTNGLGTLAFTDTQSVTNEGFVQYDHSANALRFGTVNTERMKIANDGSFRVQGVYNFTLASSANVHVDSGGLIRRVTSSAKYKTNIETIEDSYADALLNCRPVWYRSTCEGDDPDQSWWGFIAEEVAEIDPRLVHWKTTNVTYDENGQAVETPCDPEAEGVLYDRFVPHLVNLVKRQQEAIKTLETKVAALEAAE